MKPREIRIIVPGASRFQFQRVLLERSEISEPQPDVVLSKMELPQLNEKEQQLLDSNARAKALLQELMKEYAKTRTLNQESKYL